MRSLLLVAVALVAVRDVAAHQTKFGSCKAAPPVENFNPIRFNGTWYVVEQLATSSECLMTMFNVTGNNTMAIQVLSAPSTTQSFPMKVTYTNVGSLDMYTANKAKMKLKWSGGFLNKLVSTTFTVVATDYTSYGVGVECQSWGLFHRISASIYSRTAYLSAEVVTDLREQLKDKLGVDLGKLYKIDHSKCVPFNLKDYDVQYDANGLSLLSDKSLNTLGTELEVDDYFGVKQQDQYPRNLSTASTNTYSQTERSYPTSTKTERSYSTSTNAYSQTERTYPTSTNYSYSQTERSYPNSHSQAEKSYSAGTNSYSKPGNITFPTL